MQPNAIYREACTIGADFARLSPHLVGLQKKNRVAILASNESLTALEWFSRTIGGQIDYNVLLRTLYDALFDLNVECDILFPQDKGRFAAYDLLVVPALYCADDGLLLALKDYVKEGGSLVATFKTGFSNEYATVAHDRQPHLLTEVFGLEYDEFTIPENVSLTGDGFDLTRQERGLQSWMELITPTTAQTLSRYDHPYWGAYAAVTENEYGKGTASYLGAWPTEAYLRAFFTRRLKAMGLWGPEQEAAVSIRSGVNRLGSTVHYYLNYSMEEKEQPNLYGECTELLSGRRLKPGEPVLLPPWGFAILEE